MKAPLREKLVAPGLILAGSITAAHLFASSRFHRSMEESVEKVRGGARISAFPRDDLPQAIAEFAGRGVPTHSGIPVAVRLRQRAEMRFSPQGQWRPLDATQTIAIQEPAFVWYARCRFAPLFDVQVIDRFVGNEGRLEARLFGSVPVARSSGPDTDRGELMRYLAELPLSPSAILYNRSLQWRQRSDDVYEVSADSPGGTARVRLTLDAHGDVVQSSADDRPCIERGKTVPRHWSGTFKDYKDFSGCRIPSKAEVAWDLETGRFTYWRGEIVAVNLIDQD